MGGAVLGGWGCVGGCVPRGKAAEGGFVGGAGEKAKTGGKRA